MKTKGVETEAEAQDPEAKLTDLTLVKPGKNPKMSGGVMITSLNVK